MVRALLVGRKTQTRRVVKGLPERSLDFDRQWYANVLRPSNALPKWSWWDGPPHGQSIYHLAHCPYGSPGDRLYVRETWKPHSLYAGLKPREVPKSRIFYHADDAYSPSNTPWKPGIHMPRWASRLTLIITEVRAERLRDISQSDAKAEGLEWVAPGKWSVDRSLPIIGDDARAVYFQLWDHINGPGSSAANPWVWAVTFEVGETVHG